MSITGQEHARRKLKGNQLMHAGLGRAVEYRDTDNRTKLAFVIATAETIDGTDPKTGITAPDKGRAHLEVHSFTGSTYVKKNIPSGEGPLTFTPPEDLAELFPVPETAVEDDEE
jgi:hypothetical protein